MTAVTELALGMLVDLARGVSTAVAAYRAGHAPSLARGRQLHGAALGIVGFGVIGQRLADLALAFGMRVIVADPYQRQPRDGIRHTTLPDLLAEADYVVCLALSTPETANARAHSDCPARIAATFPRAIAKVAVEMLKPISAFA